MRPRSNCVRCGWVAVLVIAIGGCAGRPSNPSTVDVLFLVPGVAGDGPAYDGLVRGLREGGADAHLEVLAWGAPGPFMVMNFQDEGIHHRAEEKLAAELGRWRKAHPGGRIDVIAHSAGCGVALGALGRSGSPAVRNVVLLSPSVSPQYDLSAAMAKVAGRMDVFVSDRDELFLSWRTSTFGTYDNVKTKAAGNVGFVAATDRSKLVQHRREDWWAEQGNDGSHFGALAQTFARETIAPLLR
jgi:pimeloyl-ACP methyl ester carboxylesterase